MSNSRKVMVYAATPAVAAIVLIFIELALSAMTIESALIYLVGSYFFAILPGGLLAFTLYKISANPFVYAITGGVLGIVSISAMLQIVPFVTTDAAVWFSYLVQYWQIMVAGVMAGVFCSLMMREYA